MINGTVYPPQKGIGFFALWIKPFSCAMLSMSVYHRHQSLHSAPGAGLKGHCHWLPLTGGFWVRPCVPCPRLTSSTSTGVLHSGCVSLGRLLSYQGRSPSVEHCLVRKMSGEPLYYTHCMQPHLLWWCIFMTRSVERKYWVAIFKIKVTVGVEMKRGPTLVLFKNTMFVVKRKKYFTINRQVVFARLELIYVRCFSCVTPH